MSTVAADIRRAGVERRIGRPLRAAEQAIDVEYLDRVLNDAKDDLERAIRDEMLLATRRWLRGGSRKPVMRITPAMREPLERLHRIGRSEARAELDRAGYPVRAHAAHDPNPHHPDGLKETIETVGKGLPGVSVRIRDELVDADLSDAAAAAIARALLNVPGARDIASRVVSTALYSGMGATFEEHADLVPCWEYTAVLDAATCEECEPLDGTEYHSLDDLFEVLPNFGPNPNCDGGGRCRCRAVPCAQDEQPPATIESDPQPELTADLAYDDRLAIREYTGPAYREINAALRGAGLTRPDTEETIVALDTAIAKATPLQNERVVYRALERPLDVEIGDVFLDEGFLSTSADSDLAERWAGPAGDVWHITLTPGTRGLDLPAHGLGVGEESEILLARGQYLQIERIEERVTTVPSTGVSIHSRYVYARVVSS